MFGFLPIIIWYTIAAPMCYSSDIGGKIPEAYNCRANVPYAVTLGGNNCLSSLELVYDIGGNCYSQ